MFSGAGLYRDGVIFGLALGGGIFLKADAETEALFRAAGSHPFAFERQGRRVETSYWSVPSEALDDAESLKEWAERAYQAALRKPAKGSGRGGPRPIATSGSARSRGSRRAGSARAR